MARLLVALLLLGLLGPLGTIGTASAREESEAPLLRDDVERVWHEPEGVQAGQQFEGHLRLAPHSNVTSVHYQVCDIQKIVCVIAPRPATDAGDGHWWFDTADFQGVDGGQAHWEGRIGVQWFLGQDGLENATEFPHGTPLTDPSCEGRAVACYETHYFAFDVAPAPDRRIPAVPVAAVGAALVGLGLASRRLAG